MSVAFLFPGQGSQHVGMGEALYKREPAARAVFDQADEQLGFALSRLCFEGPESLLTDTVNQQPALLTTSIAAWRVLVEREWATTSPPDFMAGHSMGEFSALVAAGALSFTDGLTLVRKRGELMKRAGEQAPGAMAAVLGMTVEETAALCAEAQAAVNRPLQVANDNCPGQVVISGDSQALLKGMELLEAAGARRIIRLPISIAAHSLLMTSAAEEFAALVDETTIEPPRWPIIGNVTAQPLSSAAGIRAELKAQLTSQVRWTDSMNYLLQQGVDVFVEVGPGDVLLGLIKRIDRRAKRVQVEA